MNKTILAVALVAGILAISGAVAYAYANGHTQLFTTSNVDDSRYEHGTMMGSHDESDRGKRGMMYVMSDDDEDDYYEHGYYAGYDDSGVMERHSERHEYMRGGLCDGNVSLITVSGTVVAVDADLKTVTIDDGSGNLTVKVLRAYVNNETGAITFGPWIVDNIEVGSQITVAIPNSTYSDIPVYPAFSIEFGGDSYISPGFYSGICMGDDS